ncbi:hypothetical protein ACFRC2_17320, partial [Bacillus subtilis]
YKVSVPLYAGVPRNFTYKCDKVYTRLSTEKPIEHLVHRLFSSFLTAQMIKKHGPVKAPCLERTAVI